MDRVGDGTAHDHQRSAAHTNRPGGDRGAGRVRLQGATFTRITKQAGLRSPRMTSYHFANEDDLLSQLPAEVFTEGARLIVEAIAAETTAAGKLRAYRETTFDSSMITRRKSAHCKRSRRTGKPPRAGPTPFKPPASPASAAWRTCSPEASRAANSGTSTYA